MRVRIPKDEEGRVCEKDVFVIPLIEHKTRVDYDVAMQLLRYMAVIWYDYKKQQEVIKEGSSRRKAFRYPPIVPIVYYEGRASWTADMHLTDRIDLNSVDGLVEYIPDFTYKVVRVHEYRNEDLKKKHNEMSLVMMLNRIQSPEDYTEFLKSTKGYLDEIYSKTSEDIRRVYQDVLWTLFQKMNVPAEEAREKLAEMEESGMGSLFADMEKMDIQAERLNTKLAKEEADAAKKALTEFNQRLEESKQELIKSSSKMNTVFSQLVFLCQSENLSREETIACLQKRYKLDAEDAVSAVEHFWNHL